MDSAGAPTGSRGGRVADELEEHGGTTTCNTSEAKVEGGQHSTTSTSSSSLDPGDPNEPIYVTFDDDDPDNPFDWSRRRKWTLTLIGSWLTTLVAIAGPGFVMGIEDMQRDLGVSHFVASLAYGLYPLGFGIGPLVSTRAVQTSPPPWVWVAECEGYPRAKLHSAEKKGDHS